MDFEGVVKIEKILHFVVGDATINDSLFARVYNNKWQLDGRIGSRSTLLFFTFLVSFHQILEGNLLKKGQNCTFFLLFSLLKHKFPTKLQYLLEE
jgi:hypothetical protein